MTDQKSLNAMCINTIRTLAMDAVQAANSGTRGTPMAMAPVAYCLWQQFLRFDPQDPIWPNRDRFILSAGHASMLLYSLLPPDRGEGGQQRVRDLGRGVGPAGGDQAFSAVGTAAAPATRRYRWTSGVETTTGPLGQGLATSVGMAIAGQWLAARFNRPEFENLIDFNVYALCGGRLHDGGHLARGGVVAGHRSSTASAGITTTITSPSRATPL